MPPYNFNLQFKGKSSQEIKSLLFASYEKEQMLLQSYEYQTTSVNRFNSFFHIKNSVHEFVSFLIKEEKLKSIFPFYINKFIHKDTDISDYLQHLFHNIYMSSEEPFRKIEDILKDIDPKKLVGKDFWKEIYHGNESNYDDNINDKLPYDLTTNFVEKYKFYSRFTDTFSFSNHIFNMARTQNIDIIECMVKQNIEIFSKALVSSMYLSQLPQYKLPNPHFLENFLFDFYNRANEKQKAQLNKVFNINNFPYGFSHGEIEYYNHIRMKLEKLDNYLHLNNSLPPQQKEKSKSKI